MAGIDLQKFCDELRAKVSIVDVVGSKVKLVRKGREYQACCPFHNEKTPSFTVNEAKGFYHCFGCGVSGDAITFVLNEDLDVVTHRVVSIDAENQHFYTKGDANDAPDGAPVYFKNLIGRPVFTIPYLGYVSHWVSNPPGMYLAIALALVLIILTFLPDVLRKASEADARDAARRAADKPGDAPDAKNSGENMKK